ncbi:MAG TPA: gamma-glutamyl-gamma-aminobutyrate hydrolase family protein [Candidatus Saccharimonadales bacterium]|nr:gamma-glutamyl-gamma-aminobutyrate hydrolase family protein [Candidatus Saccharimonadales bacterium]
MKILLINNNTIHLPKLSNSLAGHELEAVEYMPGIKLDSSNKDLVILSGGGGEGREATDRHSGGDLWYKDEIEFILQSQTPILGICMGFELICHAYGSPVEKLSNSVIGLRDVKLPSGSKLKQFESHDWGILSVPSKELEVVADSETGIEIVKHRTRPLLGTQFHPELGGSLELQRLILSVV